MWLSMWLYLEKIIKIIEKFKIRIKKFWKLKPVV